MTWRRIAVAATLVALAVANTGCQAPGGHACHARDGVFVHITHGPGDAHAVLMGLQMAALMSADRDVLVYFDLEGVQTVLRDAPDIAYAQFPSSQAQLDKLIAAKVPVMVCPGCLKAAGKTMEDVRPGVQLANKDVFFDFTKGRILTIDY